MKNQESQQKEQEKKQQPRKSEEGQRGEKSRQIIEEQKQKSGVPRPPKTRK